MKDIYLPYFILQITGGPGTPKGETLCEGFKVIDIGQV
jgi:hypothetical protein